MQFCGFGGAPSGDSSFYQQFGPVPAGAQLSFWHWDCNTSFSIDDAWQDAYITDTDGNILQTIFHQASNAECWINETVDLSPWVGQTIRVKFLVHQDGFGDLTSMSVDDVAVIVPGPCASTPTPTPRGYTRTEVAPDAASSSISYSVRTVRFGKLASRTSRVPASPPCQRAGRVKGRFAGDQEVLRCAS